MNSRIDTRTLAELVRLHSRKVQSMCNSCWLLPFCGLTGMPALLIEAMGVDAWTASGIGIVTAAVIGYHCYRYYVQYEQREAAQFAAKLALLATADVYRSVLYVESKLFADLDEQAVELPNRALDWPKFLAQKRSHLIFEQGGEDDATQDRPAP